MNEFELIARYFSQQPALLPAGHPDSLLPAIEEGQQVGQGDACLSPAACPERGGGCAVVSPEPARPRGAVQASKEKAGPTVMHPAGHVLLGMGDDCALLRALPPGQVLAVSSDMLVEGRHFFAGTDPAAIGHKALAVNLSDLAAMGARPLGFTLALALPSVERAWLQAFSHGMLSLASRAGCPLIGGDTTRGPLTISITVMGAVPAGQALRRDGAQAGDQIWVSGPLGAAALAVEQRRAGRRADGAAALRLDWPMPRFDVGLRLLGLASAAMDISDGLAGDLNHLLNASGRRGEQPLGAALYAEALPLDTVLRALPAGRAQQHVLHGGDDYELLFTVPPVHEGRVAALCPTAQKIGQIRPGHGMLIIDTAGRSCPVSARGHDHFAQ